MLYGSGYVLLAFLRADFVDRLGWLTETQLLDAVAIGQVTPGPVFTTATFIGFLLAGVPGAIVATVAIFLPSFVFVAAIHSQVKRLRASSITAPILDAVNDAAVGLMTLVTVFLGRSALVDVPTILVALAALAVLILTKINSLWLILAGAIVGAVMKGFGSGGVADAPGSGCARAASIAVSCGMGRVFGRLSDHPPRRARAVPRILIELGSVVWVRTRR